MSLLAPIACCVVMKHTLGAALGKVVSKPSPFGRRRVELSRPIAHARVLQHLKHWTGFQFEHKGKRHAWHGIARKFTGASPQ